MIFRRPYAFLIKHFRIIHIILFVLFAYITYKANNILSFFTDYISKNGNLVIDSSSYISYFIYVAIFLITVISIVVFYLMRYKNKPKLFYIIIILISVIGGIAIIYLYNGIKLLETTSVSGRMVRLYRDISIINFWMLFITCIPIIIRGLGFDIKKFEFNRDLQELQLESKDSEEVEVSIDLSSAGVKRTGRKFFRELKYYYLDNKLIINIILCICGIVLLFMFPVNKFIINRDLNEGEIFKTNYFNIKFNDSYISDRNRTSNENSYVIVNFSVIGKIDKYKLDLKEFVLESKNNSYVPSLKYYYYFDDYGRGYKNNILSTKEYVDYILVYNIKSEDKNGVLTINYLGSDRDIKLSPEILN